MIRAKNTYAILFVIVALVAMDQAMSHTDNSGSARATLTVREAGQVGSDIIYELAYGLRGQGHNDYDYLRRVIYEITLFGLPDWGLWEAHNSAFMIARPHIGLVENTPLLGGIHYRYYSEKFCFALTCDQVSSGSVFVPTPSSAACGGPDEEIH